MNASIISLNCVSILSLSSLFYLNDQYYGKQSLSLLNSYFSRAFSSILFSSSNQHETFIRNTAFRDIQSSAIYFTSAESISNYRSHCHLTDNYIPNPQSGMLILRNKQVSDKDFQNNINCRPFFIEQNGYTCGYLKIAGCVFKNCFCGDEGGGGIFVSQHENILIYETLFDSCHSTGYCGGCCCIVGKKCQYNGMSTLKDEQLPFADIRYCCFQNCYGAPDFTMGSIMCMAAARMNLNYTSCTNCSCIIRSRGAQFDIQSQYPTSEHMNMTGGMSKFCGSLEYRYSDEGYFRYQTMMNISSKYGTCFPYSKMNQVSVVYCNYISNKIIKLTEGELSSLIYLGNYKLIVEYFYFINNKFVDGFGQFISRKGGTSGIVEMRNCYFDESDQNRYNRDFVTYYNCFLGTRYFTKYNLIHVSLGICAGKKTAEPIILSNTFSPSSKFTKSYTFSPSSQFSNSNSFSPSKMFSYSSFFTYSNLFSKSESFSSSISFSKSSYFSTSLIFTDSFLFTFSDDFSKSVFFSLSKQFSNSFYFSNSKLFTYSIFFSDSHLFSNSIIFSLSDLFSKSSFFSFSKEFSKSKKFSYSTIFTKSNIFSISDAFRKSIFLIFTHQPKIKRPLPIVIIILIPIIVLILTIFFIILFCYKRKKKTSSTNEEEPSNQQKSEYDKKTNETNKTAFQDEYDRDLDFWL